MSERKFDVFASLQAEARRIGQEGLAALTSLSGGALGVINTARSLGFRKGIPFLLAIAMGLSACGGGVTPTAESPTREPEIPTVPSEASPIISEQPAGFGLTPGPEANPTPSPDLAEISGEIYVVPTKADEQNYRRAEATPPESIKDEVARYKAEMEKVKASVAQECAVDPAKLKTVFKEGSVGNEYRWTVVYETTDGQTCWAINAATGRLGQYPTYFDAASGRVRSIQDGISWERVDGSMDWFGTVPGLIRPGQYVVPEGMTGLQLSDQANWNTLEVGVAGETGVEIKSPFAEADMNTLNQAGYVWNGANGTLERNGQFVLGYDGRSWVDEAGVESSIESLKINLTNGVDFEGKPIVAMLTREVDGQREMYNFIIDDWQEPMDIAGSIEAVSKNNIPKSLENWKVQVKIEFEGVHEATWDDFRSGRLFLSDLLNLGHLPENVNIQPLLISQEPLIQNVWTLGQFRAAHLDYYGEPGSGEIPPNKNRPVLVENDAIRVVSAHKMRSPLTGEWLTVTGVRYQVNGQDLLLYSFTGGSTTVSTENGGAFNIVEDFWSYPARRVLLPIVSSREGDFCNFGPLYAAQNVCDLVGYDGTPAPRDLLPQTLQSLIASWDSDEQLTSSTLETYPVGDWIFSLQKAVLPANIAEHRGIYFLSEDDPRLDTIWAD